jgi:hypothetical protein
MEGAGTPLLRWYQFQARLDAMFKYPDTWTRASTQIFSYGRQAQYQTIKLSCLLVSLSLGQYKHRVTMLDYAY